MQDPNTHETGHEAAVGSDADIPSSASSAAASESPRAPSAAKASFPGLKIARRYTEPGEDVWSTVEWEKRSAVITDGKGEVVFEQHDIETPKSYTQLATNVIASKYFRGHVGAPEREYSVRQLIQRVSYTIADWGKGMGYFASDPDYLAFRDELTHLLLHQKAAFNSPVWFNVGLKDQPKPQCSACFINSVDDTMESILGLAKTEGMLFKFGSGTGTNLSPLRSSRERLQGGGTASGPVSFMRGFDAFAGVIKSGGKTRRAAKMVILNVDHPDIMQFITCKADEEKKAWALIDAGYNGNFNVPGGAYDSVSYQNANHSVRVTDEFMEAYLGGKDWSTREVTTGNPDSTYKAAELMRAISDAAWVCGDPGMQYDTTINRWHTCKATDRIHASNPCCVTGDTLIAVADGRNAVPIRELVGQEAPVYAHDHASGRTVVSRMWNIGIKRQQAPVYRVTLDDGSTFRATDDHLIMLRDGAYRMVRDLKAGDSLMPFHSKVLAPAETRTKRRYYWSGRAWKPQYRAVWEQAHGGAPAGFHIHHRDFDALNDRPDNLELLAAEQHNALHAERMRGDLNPARRCMADAWRQHIAEAVRGERNGHYRHPHSESARELMRAKAAGRWADPAERARSGVAVREALARAKAEGRPVGRPRGESYQRCCPVCRASFETRRTAQIFCSAECRYSPMGLQMCGAKTAERNRGRHLSREHRARLSASVRAASDPATKRSAAAAAHRNTILRAARLLRDADVPVTLKSWDALREQARALGVAHVPTASTVARHFRDDAELNEHAALYNHKVVSVEFCGHEDVYDGTVDTHHNFAILTSEEDSCVAGAVNYSGVFIHNSEFVFLNDTACNLSSINLMKFRREDGEFDVEGYKHACRILITAQEIIVGNASYPTERIGINSHDYRPLGLGYANLGALLMSRGVAYDSDAGRALAGAITAVMTGEAYHQSAIIARDHRLQDRSTSEYLSHGAFPGYPANREAMLDVMRMHRAAVEHIDAHFVPDDLLHAARSCWDRAIELGERYGYRNSQATVLAPTGCLVGNSLVLTDRGLMRLGMLGDVNGEQWQDVNFDVLTDDGPRRATKFYVNGVEQTRRITTSCGYAIQGTLKHRVKVTDPLTGRMEWKRFADIAPGDVVALAMGEMVGGPRVVNLPPLGEEYWTGDYITRTPRTMTPELAELVGYFMGDGSLHSKGPRFCVANTDADVAERIRLLMKALFNLDAHTTDHGGYTEVTAHSVPLALWWEASGFTKRRPSPENTGKGYLPRVPDAVLATNDPAVYGAFLRGLFEADGTVTGGAPCWSSTHREFSEEVKTLLLALGIPTTTKQDTSAWGNTALYVLRVRNASFHAPFQERVGFISARKRSAVTTPSKEQAARYDYIFLDPAVARSLAPAGHPQHNAVELALKRHGAITRRAAQALYAETGDSRLGHALRFYYDVVAANEDGGEQLTYDLSVPDNVTYIAGGFISHNTISFMMDCDTTGIEPDIAIVKYKNLVGGGLMKIVNNTVPEALRRLGYDDTQVGRIVQYIDEHDTIEGAPDLKAEHLSIFDCAFKPANGSRSIQYMGHVKMMAAAQPFISGAISKTVNMPTEATAREITDVYVEGWRLGLKAIAIYRDGSKRTQPLSTSRGETDKETGRHGDKETVTVAIPAPTPNTEHRTPNAEGRMVRRKLPDERRSITHKFSIAGHEGYITVGMYEDGTPGEIFLTMSKEGSTISGLMDTIATMTSLALQYGVPLETLVTKFAHMRFEPSGITPNPDIRFAKSIPDYIFRWLGTKFLPHEALPGEEQSLNGNGHDVAPAAPPAAPPTAATQMAQTDSSQPTPRAYFNPFTTREKEIFENMADAPACAECGALMVRNGACYKCLNCGSVFGCS